MPPTYTLSVPDPQPGIPPGDRWCALSGPHAPLPAILASADEWLLIAGAIEAGKARSAGARFTPDATGGYLDALGTMSVAYLTTADLLALAADIRAKLAPSDRPGCPAPIEATAEEMDALLAIAASRPRQTDPTDPDVIASAPRPTVADQPAPTAEHDLTMRVARSIFDARCPGIRWTDEDAPAYLAAAKAAIDGMESPASEAPAPAEIEDIVGCIESCDAVDNGDLRKLVAALREAQRLVECLRDDFNEADRARRIYMRDLNEKNAELAAVGSRQAPGPATPPTFPADLRGLLDALVAAQDARLEAAIPGGEAEWQRRHDAFVEAAHAVAEWHRGAGGRQ